MSRNILYYWIDSNTTHRKSQENFLSYNFWNIRYGPNLGEIQIQNGIFSKKLKNFENKSIDFNLSIIYRPWIGLPDSGATRNIRPFLLSFFDLQSSLSRYRILIFRILKICLAVPSGSHYDLNVMLVILWWWPILRSWWQNHYVGDFLVILVTF